MKNIYRGRFFWAKINEDVEPTFLECRGCQREAKSKVKKTCKVIPPDLTQIAPAESISIDNISYNKQDILVIKGHQDTSEEKTNQPQNQSKQ